MARLVLCSAVAAGLAVAAMQVGPHIRCASPHAEIPAPQELPTLVNTGWQPLFNGRDFTGWEVYGGGIWRVDGQTLVLENDAGRNPGYVVSELRARDFEARFRCKVWEGDSGFLFRARTQPHDPRDVIGPQVQLNMEPGQGLGGIFELQGRGWLRRVDSGLNDRLISDSDWLDVEVDIRGDQIVVRINGETTVDFRDDPAVNPHREAGFFAWQIHGGGRCKVAIQSARVRALE